MKVVLLAGGYGTRISEESDLRPKPMVEIGGKPIIWHIMKTYAHYGFNEFIICAGYKQEYIKQWFANYFINMNDVTFDYTNGGEVIIHQSKAEPWKVTICDTGYKTQTGGRIKRIEPYVKGETFMMTYGDGVSDIDIQSLLQFHKSHGKTATLSSVIRQEQKGVLEITPIGSVQAFREKSKSDGTPINVGYMVLEPEIFKYLTDDQTVFENEPMCKLIEDGQLMSYQHKGFWQCMDTLLEMRKLEAMWDAKQAPWKVWE